MPDSNDFFETDEPIEDVIAAFEAGDHVLTAPPVPAGGHLVGVAPSSGSFFMLPVTSPTPAYGHLVPASAFAG